MTTTTRVQVKKAEIMTETNNAESSTVATPAVKAATKKAAVKKVAGKPAPTATTKAATKKAVKKAVAKKVTPKADRVIVKPEGLRNPQVVILRLLKNNPNGLTRASIAEKLAAEQQSANLSEMIGSPDSEPNKYTTTLCERKYVRLEVQEQGKPLVIATASGLKALEKAEKDLAAAAK